MYIMRLDSRRAIAVQAEMSLNNILFHQKVEVGSAKVSKK